MFKLKNLKTPSSNVLGGQLETLINMTKKYGGVTIIPEMILEYLGDEEKRLTRPFKGKALSREVSIVSRRFFEKEEIINVVESTILECLPQSIRSLKKTRVRILPIT